MQQELLPGKAGLERRIYVRHSVMQLPQTTMDLVSVSTPSQIAQRRIKTIKSVFNRDDTAHDTNAEHLKRNPQGLHFKWHQGSDRKFKFLQDVEKEPVFVVEKTKTFSTITNQLQQRNNTRLVVPQQNIGQAAAGASPRKPSIWEKAKKALTPQKQTQVVNAPVSTQQQNVNYFLQALTQRNDRAPVAQTVKEPEKQQVPEKKEQNPVANLFNRPDALEENKGLFKKIEITAPKYSLFDNPTNLALPKAAAPVTLTTNVSGLFVNQVPQKPKHVVSHNIFHTEPQKPKQTKVQAPVKPIPSPPVLFSHPTIEVVAPSPNPNKSLFSNIPASQQTNKPPKQISLFKPAQTSNTSSLDRFTQKPQAKDNPPAQFSQLINKTLAGQTNNPPANLKNIFDLSTKTQMHSTAPSLWNANKESPPTGNQKPAVLPQVQSLFKAHDQKAPEKHPKQQTPKLNIFGKPMESQTLKAQPTAAPTSNLLISGNQSSIFTQKPTPAEAPAPTANFLLFSQNANQPNIFSTASNNTGNLFQNALNNTAKFTLFGDLNKPTEQPQQSMFGQKSYFDKKEDEDDEQGDDEGEDELIEEVDNANPALTEKYAYQTVTETVAKGVANHLRKNNSEDVSREIVVSLERHLGNKKCYVFVRSIKTKILMYEGAVLPGQTSIKFMNANHQNVKIEKLVSMENGKPKFDVLKIQFKEESDANNFLKEFEKCLV